MKILNQEEPVKVCVIATKEIYYTFNNLPSMLIDGVEFIGVFKNKPTSDSNESPHLMRKDSVEYIN